MSGTKAGGLRAAAENKKKYGRDFYARIGSKGGKNGHTGGFYANPALAREAGAAGGRKSRKTPKVDDETFIRIWNESNSVRYAAIKLGYSTNYTRSRANTLRSRGLSVKQYGAKRTYRQPKEIPAPTGFKKFMSTFGF